MNEAKQELIRSWLLKALRDLRAAERLAEQPEPLLDIAVYHCQQAAEKALKGYLAFWDQRVEKTHDLRLLLDRAQQFEPGLGAWSDAADNLTPFATAYRYPGLVDQPEPEEFDEAIEDTRRLVNQILALLPSAVHPESHQPERGS